MATEANREVSSLSQSIYEKDGSEISLEEQLSAKAGQFRQGVTSPGKEIMKKNLWSTGS